MGLTKNYYHTLWWTWKNWILPSTLDTVAKKLDFFSKYRILDSTAYVLQESLEKFLHMI